jgi:hypothetical protein
MSQIKQAMPSESIYIFPFIAKSSKWFLSLRFTDPYFVLCISHFPLYCPAQLYLLEFITEAILREEFTLV